LKYKKETQYKQHVQFTVYGKLELAYYTRCYEISRSNVEKSIFKKSFSQIPENYNIFNCFASFLRELRGPPWAADW